MAKLSKKAKALQGKVDSTKLYALTDALALVKDAATAKFGQNSQGGLFRRRPTVRTCKPKSASWKASWTKPRSQSRSSPPTMKPCGALLKALASNPLPRVARVQRT